MFLYPLPALVTSFPRTFIIKSNVNNGRNPSSCLFPVIAFINKEVTSCVNEEATGAINEAAIDTMSFTVAVAPSVNRPDFSFDSTILIILSISSFEMNKVNPFLALAFISNLSNTYEVALVANLGKTYLAKGTTSLTIPFCQNYLLFYHEILLIEWF